MRILKLSQRCNQKNLSKFGFKQYGSNFKNIFPLFIHNGETLIQAEFLVSLQDNYIGYDIIDVCNDTLYLPYYDTSFSNNNIVLEKVKKNFNELITGFAKKNIIQKRGIICQGME